MRSAISFMSTYKNLQLVQIVGFGFVRNRHRAQCFAMRAPLGHRFSIFRGKTSWRDPENKFVVASNDLKKLEILVQNQTF